MPASGKRRCEWAVGDPMVRYHDREWGVPVHNDRRLFENLVLEGAQAGLSWATVLKKRPAYRKAFDHVDAKKIAQYTAGKVRTLLANPGILRNRLKIQAAIHNARIFLAVQQEFGSFDRCIWQFTGGHPIRNRWRSLEPIPARTAESDATGPHLQTRGVAFVGPTTCDAFMQALGMVSDHVMHCFRYPSFLTRHSSRSR